MPPPALASRPPIVLRVREPASGLLDEPFVLDAQAGAEEVLAWRARLRDDDGRVWRAHAADPRALTAAWRPAKSGARPFPALQSLRPVAIDVRVEAPDGRAAARTLTRRLLGEGVRVRRWRDALTAVLHLPAGPAAAAVLVDARGTAEPSPAAMAAPLLASRGVLVLVVARGETAAAFDRLAAVPSAPQDARVLPASAVVLPPNVGARDEDEAAAAARERSWDALLADLGARPRGRP